MKSEISNFSQVFGNGRLENIERDIEILNGAAGFLRHVLGKSVNWRVTPALKFEFDKSILEGAKIERLLSEAKTNTSNDSVSDALDDNDELADGDV